MKQQAGRQTRDESAAGWSYFQSGSCQDGHAGVSYPWHEEYVGHGADGRAKPLGYCARCGERRPDRKVRRGGK